MMKKNLTHLTAYICVVLGLSVTTAFAQIGLEGMTPEAAGDVVQQALANEYAAEKTAEEIAAKIKEILEEAVATGNDQIIQRTVVAIFNAGGVANLALSRSAVNAAATSGSLGTYQAAVQNTANSTAAVMGSAIGTAGSGGVMDGQDTSDGDVAATPI